MMATIFSFGAAVRIILPVAAEPTISEVEFREKGTDVARDPEIRAHNREVAGDSKVRSVRTDKHASYV